MCRPRRSALLVAGVLAVAVGGACRKDGCLGGDDGRCLPPAACPGAYYSCDGLPATLSVGQLADYQVPATDPKALAAPGDFVMENDLVRVVLDAPTHPHHLAPSGGSIIDLWAKSADGIWSDQTNAVYHAAGLLPRDAVHYDGAQVLDHRGDAAPYVAVVFRGRLEGNRRVTVVSRYELRPCEPGVRVRSDLYNGADDTNTLYLTDGFFWGDHTLLPFVPGKGLGFRAPDLDLEHVDAAWREWPFLAARPEGSSDSTYAAVPCNHDRGAGFNSTTLTANGVPLRATQPGDGTSFERFLLATPGPGLGAVVGEALHVRAMVHGEAEPVSVTGRIVAGGRAVESGRATSLLFYEPAFGVDPDDESRRVPWTEAVPETASNKRGQFRVALPPDRSYRIQAYAFGRPVGPPTSFVVGRTDVDLGDISVVAPAHLTVNVDGPQGTPRYAQVVVVPAEPSTPAPTFYGLFPGCEVMLGPPHGAAPACNRALTGENGQVDLLVPPGRYYVYATRGPFATLDRALVDLAAGAEVSLALVTSPLKLFPPGTLSGDFHVHGAGSYDSAIPDQDRVISFLAAGLDVIVATDHDVVTTYADTVAMVGGNLTVIPGVEQTPNIPWFAVPGERFPKTLGHFNFWPLAGSGGRRISAPWDELREPGQLMDDIEPAFSPAGAGVRQLNHPYSESKLGRDQGFLRAIGYDPHDPIAKQDSFAAQVLTRSPGGGRRNLDWDVQEVMTGASRADWLRYRALWFSLLSQGELRAGTANSDTHSLALEQVGYPRNLIFTCQDENKACLDPQQPEAPFDVARFDAHVRAGHMVGTNGPVLDVTIVDQAPDGTSVSYGPDVTVAKARRLTSAATLNIVVSGAPWIPIEEVRVIVNGAVRLRARNMVAAAAQAVDIFGAQPWRFSLDPVPVSSLIPMVQATPDSPRKPVPHSWLIVEAGIIQNDEPDTDGDGLPDLQPDATPHVRLDDLQVIAPDVWPTAFTNPFLIDSAGDGWQAPGLP
jgi:hypothetical protein